MRPIIESLPEGHFAKKQLFSRDRIISWSHTRRFETAIKLGRRFTGKRVLDYGCGDGTFIAMLMSESEPPSKAVGAEVNTATVLDCQRRMSSENLAFVRTDTLSSAEHQGAYDAVYCMEVLEHVRDPEPLYHLVETVLAPGGTLVISVPVETGLPLIMKQTVRRIAGWRGIGDYPGTASYSFAEYCKSIFAGRHQHITRTVLHDEAGSPFHDHKGFNWMALRDSISRHFTVYETLTSPVAWVSPHLASQVWFLARKRSSH
jgi:SAM-dependent methyltransferase